MKPTIDLNELVGKIQKKLIYLEEMPEGLMIETKEMLIVDTGENKKSPAVTEPLKNAL